jgi:Glycosyl transferases group 1
MEFTTRRRCETAGLKVSPSRLEPGRSGQLRVLLLSMRRLANLVAYCIPYEFEDVIAEVTGADRVDVGDVRALERSRRAYKLLRLTSRSARVARRLALRPSTIELPYDYDLFFPIFNNTHELYALATVPDWRGRCRHAVCYISEAWEHMLPEYLLELLRQFDHVFIGVRHSVETVARMVGRPCSYMPVAADVLRFYPGPIPAPRSIDVCNIGRRSAVTHHALVNAAVARTISYYFDTFAGGSGKLQKQRTFNVENHREHRLLLAQILQRSRYYIAHRSRINEPEYTGSHEEIPGRFFEGVAAGTVLLGQPPTTKEFCNLFDWPDAVIPMPFDCPDIERVISELDRQPARLQTIRKHNIHHAALKHDWLHRLKIVLETLGLTVTDEMQQRERQLRAVALSALAD